MPNNVRASLSYVPETQHVSLTSEEFERDVSVAMGGGYRYRGENWHSARYIAGRDTPDEYRLSRLAERPSNVNWSGSATGRLSEDPVAARWMENAYAEFRRQCSNEWDRMAEKALAWGEARKKQVKTSVVAHGNCRIIYVMPAGPYRETRVVKKEEKKTDTCQYRVRWNPQPRVDEFDGFEITSIWADEMTFEPAVGVAA